MKLNFKLWGIHPEWPHRAPRHNVWVNITPEYDEISDEEDKFCISFCSGNVPDNAKEKGWADYTLKRLV